MVLLHFYDDEIGILSEWWVPLANLTTPANAAPPRISLETLAEREVGMNEKDVKTEMTGSDLSEKHRKTAARAFSAHHDLHLEHLRLNFSSLQKVFARNIVLAFFSHAGLLLSLMPQPSDVLAIDTKELLFLATQEYEKQHPLNFTSSLNIRKQNKQLELLGASSSSTSSHMNVSREISHMFSSVECGGENGRPIEKLLAMYAKETSEGKYEMCDVLVEACAQKLREEIQFVAENSLFIAKRSQNQSVSRVERVDIARAHSVVVMFDRSETKIHSTIQSGMNCCFFFCFFFCFFNRLFLLNSLISFQFTFVDFVIPLPDSHSSDGFVLGYYHDADCTNAIVEITSLAAFLPHTLPNKFYHKFSSKTYELSLAPPVQPTAPVLSKKPAKTPIKPISKVAVCGPTFFRNIFFFALSSFFHFVF
jgi:hypothetical protein